MVIDNMKSSPELIAESNSINGINVINSKTWELVISKSEYGRE